MGNRIGTVPLMVRQADETGATTSSTSVSKPCEPRLSKRLVFRFGSRQSSAMEPGTLTADGQQDTGFGDALQSAGLVELCLFLVLWTGAAVFFDALMLRTAFYQIWPATYPTTAGEITRSRVRDDAPDPLDLRYVYAVDGEQLVGRQFNGRYNRLSVEEAARVVASFPVGTPVTVYYHPKDPSRSQLIAGLSGELMLGLWLLALFNMLAAGGWALVVSEVRRLRRGEASRNLPVSERGGKRAVHAAVRTPLVIATGYAIVSAVLIIIVLGVVYESAAPLLLVLAAVGGWSLTIVGVYVFCRLLWVVVVFDLNARTLRLPRLRYGNLGGTYRFADAVAVEVEPRVYRDFHGELQRSHAPVLVLQEVSGQTRHVCLAGRYGPAEAEELARLLRDHIQTGTVGRAADSLAGGCSAKTAAEAHRVLDSTTVASRPKWQGVRLRETARTIEIVPGTIPLPAVAVCLAFPIAAAIGAWWIGAADAADMAPFWVLAPFALLGCLALVHYINECERGRGKFLILDKASGEIDLPRAQVQMDRRHVVGVVLRKGEADFELHGLTPESPQDENAHKFAELSLLARDEAGEIIRYPIVADSHLPKLVIQCGRRIAHYCKVPHRMVGPDEVLSWEFGAEYAAKDEARDIGASALRRNSTFTSTDRRKLTIAAIVQVLFSVVDVVAMLSMLWTNWPWWATALFVPVAPIPLIAEWYKCRLKRRTPRTPGREAAAQSG